MQIRPGHATCLPFLRLSRSGGATPPGPPSRSRRRGESTLVPAYFASHGVGRPGSLTTARSLSCGAASINLIGVWKVPGSRKIRFLYNINSKPILTEIQKSEATFRRNTTTKQIWLAVVSLAAAIAELLTHVYAGGRQCLADVRRQGAAAHQDDGGQQQDAEHTDDAEQLVVRKQEQSKE